MDPTQSNDGLYFGPDAPEDDNLSLPFDVDVEDFAASGPGEGDATIMAWARAM